MIPSTCKGKSTRIEITQRRSRSRYRSMVREWYISMRAGGVYNVVYDPVKPSSSLELAFQALFFIYRSLSIFTLVSSCVSPISALPCFRARAPLLLRRTVQSPTQHGWLLRSCPRTRSFVTPTFPRLHLRVSRRSLP